jgi:aspartokinase
MANRGKRPQKQRDYLLRGNIVKCGCCGYAMSYDRISDPVFRCYHTAADPNADCHKLKIVVSELDEVVLAVIRKKAEQVLKCADLSKLRRKTVDEQQLADCEKDVLKNAEERQRLYERFVLGELDLESYQRLKDEWNSRLERLNQQIAAMKSELDAGKITPRSVAAAKSAVSETANNRELAETLIETVKVFPDKRIEVNWKISEFGIAE